MNNRWIRKIVLAGTAALFALLMSACDSKPEGSASASTGSVLGTYENANENSVINLQDGNKVTMIVDGENTNLTWEMDGADKVVIHGMEGVSLVFTINSEGNLSDGMGSVFRKK